MKRESRIQHRQPESHRHQVTQETVDRMAELRRQGLTYCDIGNRLGCSERTARRYVGHVQPSLKRPSGQAKADSEEIRRDLADDFAHLMQRLWDKVPSVAFVNEAIRCYKARLARTDAATLELLAGDQRMRTQLFKEVMTPLYRDYGNFRAVEQVFSQLPDHVPREWLPGGAWAVEAPDDEFDP